MRGPWRQPQYQDGRGHAAPPSPSSRRSSSCGRSSSAYRPRRSSAAARSAGPGAASPPPPISSSIHHRHQPSLPLVFFNGQIRASSDVVDAAIDAFDIQGAPDAAERRPVLRFNDYNRRRNFKVHGSCDGLLLLSLSNNGFYICNPATRQWIALPSLTGAHVAGLYKHSSSGEYCILFWKGRRQLDVVYFVLTVGSSVEPRCIGQPAASPSIKQCIAAGIMYSSEYPPALLSSCLHWVGLSLKTGLIVFDTVAETFRFIHSPATYNCADDHLLEMNGTLGISRINNCRTTVELFVLQNYEAEIWSLKNRIKLPVVEMRNIANNNRFNGIVVSDKGDVLVHSFGSWHMFHCDRKGKLQQKFRWDRVFPELTGHWFKESLVKHVFFQNQDCGRVRQPHFFRGASNDLDTYGLPPFE